MRRKHRDIIFDTEGIPAGQQTLFDFENEPAHAKPRKKRRIPSDNKKFRIKTTEKKGCTVQ